MDAKLTSHLFDGESDVLTCWDYASKGEFPFEILENYKNVSLLAWSFGVFVAEQCLAGKKERFQHRIAINGTGNPVDDSYGIPEAVFQGTLAGLNGRTLNKFYMRIFGGKSAFDLVKTNLPERSVENQIEELAYLGQMAKEITKVETIHKKDLEIANSTFCLKEMAGDEVFKIFNWTLSLIGLHDKIFLLENMKNYWNLNNTQVTEISAPHYPFAEIKSWSEFIFKICVK